MSKIKIINENYIHAQDNLFGGEIGNLVINQKRRNLRGNVLMEGATGIVMNFTPAQKDLYNSYSVPQGEYYNNDFTWRKGKQSNIAGSIQINWIGNNIIETIILKPTEKLQRDRDNGWYGNAQKLSNYVVTADKSMELAKEQKLIQDRETEYNNFVSKFQSLTYSNNTNPTHTQKIHIATKAAYKEAIDKCLQIFDREDWYENRFTLWADFMNWIEKDFRNKYHTDGIEQVLFGGQQDTWMPITRWEQEPTYDKYSIHFTLASNFDTATMCDIAGVANGLEKEIKEYISNTPDTLLTNEEVKKFNYQQVGCSLKNADIVKRSGNIEYKTWSNPIVGQHIKIKMEQGIFHIS